MGSLKANLSRNKEVGQGTTSTTETHGGIRASLLQDGTITKEKEKVKAKEKESGKEKTKEKVKAKAREKEKERTKEKEKEKRRIKPTKNTGIAKTKRYPMAWYAVNIGLDATREITANATDGIRRRNGKN